jgi:hypothetical protein
MRSKEENRNPVVTEKTEPKMPVIIPAPRNLRPLQERLDFSRGLGIWFEPYFM